MHWAALSYKHRVEQCDVFVIIFWPHQQGNTRVSIIVCFEVRSLAQFQFKGRHVVKDRSKESLINHFLLKKRGICPEMAPRKQLQSKGTVSQDEEGEQSENTQVGNILRAVIWSDLQFRFRAKTGYRRQIPASSHACLSNLWGKPSPKSGGKTEIALSPAEWCALAQSKIVARLARQE